MRQTEDIRHHTICHKLHMIQNYFSGVQMYIVHDHVMSNCIYKNLDRMYEKKESWAFLFIETIDYFFLPF